MLTHAAFVPVSASVSVLLGSLPAPWSLAAGAARVCGRPSPLQHVVWRFNEQHRLPPYSAALPEFVLAAPCAAQLTRGCRAQASARLQYHLHGWMCVRKVSGRGQ
jgi:hypothetical protein